MEINDTFPLSICSNCKIELTRAYEFKQQCIKSYETLQIDGIHSELADIRFSLIDYIKADGDIPSCDNPSDNNDNDEPTEPVPEQEPTTREQEVVEVRPSKRRKKPKYNHPITCDVCYEGFSLEDDLQIHMIAHPNDDNPVCTMCNKQFNDLKVLRRHVRIHMKRKPFQVR